MNEPLLADAAPARVLPGGPSVPETLEHAQAAALDPDLDKRAASLEEMAHAATLPDEARALAGRAHCQRCEVIPRKVAGPGTLLLNLPHTHTLGKVMLWLRKSGLTFNEKQGVLTVCVPEGSLAPIVGPLSEVLTSTERAYTRVLFQPGSLPLGPADLFAAEDIGTFAGRAGGGWLLDLLREQRLVSHFQPIVDRAGAVHGYECLARGVVDDRTVMPDAIFGTAKSADLVFQTDMAARRAAILSADRAGIREKVFVNFTPNSVFEASHCLDSTVRLIDELKIERERVVFEVTETEQLPDLDHLASIVAYYRDKGFGVALDDVGSGYSSLNVLLAIRPDYVKIDRTLVSDVNRDERKAILTGKLLETAHELGSRTIFEGVEREEEWAWAKARGVGLAQGYLFARPAANPPLRG